MPMPLALRGRRLQRSFVACALLVATGGLILYRAPDSAARGTIPVVGPATGNGLATFSGPGAHGSVALSHTKVLAGQTNPVFAEVRMTADVPEAERAKVRAPLSMSVVLDTSGSMSGDKIEEAKRSVLRLLADMRDDDEIAFIRYSSDAEVLQPLARVGNVREALRAHVQAIRAEGGTNIPAGLGLGLRALDEASAKRVRRIVLLSDGLDGTRVQSEAIATQAFGKGITTSSLGIGLDFDEAYMGGVAQTGHGNFAFVKDGAALAGFLKRELEEASSTTIENAEARLRLPEGVHFIAAHGADGVMRGDELVLSMGSLFAGDERRVIVELAADGGRVASQKDLTSSVSWTKVGATGRETAAVPTLALVATSSEDEVVRGRDGATFASATSVLASKRQLEATQAYARGDVGRAMALAAENKVALGAAIAAAPPTATAALQAQSGAYEGAADTFAKVAPSSTAGRAHAKAAAAKDMSNLSRKSF